MSGAPHAGLSYRSRPVLRVRRLLRHSAARRSERAFVVEGPKVLGLALDARARVEEVFVDAAGLDLPVVAQAHEAGVAVHPLAGGVLERISDTMTPQPVLGVVRSVDVPLAEVAGASLLLVCASVRDPGNLGTVVRVAENAGAGAVVCCAGSVDPYNPKAVRASAGALFGVALVDGGEPGEVLEVMGQWGVRRLGTRADGGTPYDRADLTAPTALVLGNEAHGLGSELDALLDGSVSIPMAGRTGSLNVAMAAAVLSFEAARQRRGGS